MLNDGSDTVGTDVEAEETSTEVQNNGENGETVEIETAALPDGSKPNPDQVESGETCYIPQDNKIYIDFSPNPTFDENAVEDKSMILKILMDQIMHTIDPKGQQPVQTMAQTIAERTGAIKCGYDVEVANSEYLVKEINETMQDIANGQSDAIEDEPYADELFKTVTPEAYLQQLNAITDESLNTALADITRQARAAVTAETEAETDMQTPTSEETRMSDTPISQNEPNNANDNVDEALVGAIVYKAYENANKIITQAVDFNNSKNADNHHAQIQNLFFSLAVIGLAGEAGIVVYANQEEEQNILEASIHAARIVGPFMFSFTGLHMLRNADENGNLTRILGSAFLAGGVAGALLNGFDIAGDLSVDSEIGNNTQIVDRTTERLAEVNARIAEIDAGIQSFAEQARTDIDDIDNGTRDDDILAERNANISLGIAESNAQERAALITERARLEGVISRFDAENSELLESEESFTAKLQNMSWEGGSLGSLFAMLNIGSAATLEQGLKIRAARTGAERAGRTGFDETFSKLTSRELEDYTEQLVLGLVNPENLGFFVANAGRQLIDNAKSEDEKEALRAALRFLQTDEGKARYKSMLAPLQPRIDMIQEKVARRDYERLYGDRKGRKYLKQREKSAANAAPAPALVA